MPSLKCLPDYIQGAWCIGRAIVLGLLKCVGIYYTVPSMVEHRLPNGTVVRCNCAMFPQHHAYTGHPQVLARCRANPTEYEARSLRQSQEELRPLSDVTLAERYGLVRDNTNGVEFFQPYTTVDGVAIDRRTGHPVPEGLVDRKAAYCTQSSRGVYAVTKRF